MGSIPTGCTILQHEFGWLNASLQRRGHRFESDMLLHLWTCNSVWLECDPDTIEVAGSNPATSTMPELLVVPSTASYIRP